MKTTPRPSRKGVNLAFHSRPNSHRKDGDAEKRSGIAPMSFSVPNFKDGATITYTFTPAGYRYQLAGFQPVQTDCDHPLNAAALARKRYGRPPIGGASYAKQVAA